jgi:hypothetical protein
MSKQIVFNIDEIEALVTEAGNLVWKPESEDALIKLFEMKDKIEEALLLVKKEVIKKGRELLPSFKGVEGDRVRAYLKKVDKYSYDKNKAKPIEVMRKIEFYKLDEAKVEEFLIKNKKLPDNVSEKQEQEILVFKVKDEETQRKKIEAKL